MGRHKHILYDNVRCTLVLKGRDVEAAVNVAVGGA